MFFSDPFVAGSGDFYAILQEQRGEPATRWDWDFALSTALLRRVHGGRVLDIGAGTGVVLSKLDMAWHRVATEVSSDAQDHLRRQGITVYASLRDVEDHETERFDVITLFQVLEHIADFDTVLAAARRLLRSGGSFVISVPNGDRTDDLAQRLGRYDPPPNHVAWWTSSSLCAVLRRGGFVVQQVAIEPPSLQGFLRVVYGAVKARAGDPDSLEARAYGIARPRVRAVGLLLLAAMRLPFVFGPAWRLRGGHHLAVVATIAAP